MFEIKPRLFIVLAFGVCIATSSKPKGECEIRTITPTCPFEFAQQMFWDNRTNSIYFTDAGAADGSKSLFRYDWKTAKLYGASIKNAASKAPVSFAIPSASSPNHLIASQTQSVLSIKWDGVSSKAEQLKVIASRISANENNIDRGTTSPDGTLYMSIIPKTYCKKESKNYPAAAIVYLSTGNGFRSASIQDALRPGTYSNGLAFDSKTSKCYVADDCSASVFETNWNWKDGSLKSANTIFRFPRDTKLTNYPSGLVLDRCSNFYVGDHNSGVVYYVDSKTGKVLKKYTVPGSHITAVGIVGKDLDYLCVFTGRAYHDVNGDLKSTSTNPGDGKMYLIPISRECCGHGCTGNPGVPVWGF